MTKFVPLIIILLFLNSCKKEEKIYSVGILPFENISTRNLDSVSKAIQKVYHFKTVILNKKELPKSAFTEIKSPRYRADSLLRFLKRQKPDSIDYIIGITTKDISITKLDADGKIKQPKYKYLDWGIFGLGYINGPSCIVSTYRLKNNKSLFFERLQKISAHEIGHNLGLHHCKSIHNCIMKDAAETIKTIDNVELELCVTCKEKLTTFYP